MEIKDIKGEKFGRLTAVERAGKQGRHVLWRFKCECGNEKNIDAWTLTSG